MDKVNIIGKQCVQTNNNLHYMIDTSQRIVG